MRIFFIFPETWPLFLSAWWIYAKDKTWTNVSVFKLSQTCVTRQIFPVLWLTKRENTGLWLVANTTCLNNDPSLSQEPRLMMQNVARTSLATLICLQIIQGRKRALLFKSGKFLFNVDSRKFSIIYTDISTFPRSFKPIPVSTLKCQPLLLLHAVLH